MLIGYRTFWRERKLAILGLLVFLSGIKLFLSTRINSEMREAVLSDLFLKKAEKGISAMGDLKLSQSALKYW